MNNQLLAKLKKRQEASGMVIENEPVKTSQPVAEKKAETHQSNAQFQANKNRLKAFFEQKHGGGDHKAEEKATAPKETIKGDSEGFANARKLLQQGLGKQGGTSSGSGSSGLPSLPPLPPGIANLPPPPPPPSLDIFNLPPPPPPPSLPSLSLDLPLPPPPSLGTLNLPPPPSLDSLSLSPPPSLNTLNLPPPPPPPNSGTKVQKTSALSDPPSLPSFNLPPAPSLPQVTNKKQQKVEKVPHFDLPPPPPPPSFDIPVENKAAEIASSKDHSQSVQFKKTQSIEVEQQRQIPPINEDLTKIQKPVQKTIEEKKESKTQQKVFQVTKPKKSQHEGKVSRQSTRNKKPNITKQFFGNDVAGFIKRQFVRQTDILNTIGTKVEKRLYNFNFPSIENHVRDIEPIEALYADGTSLDLVSCYMQKNVNAARKHNEARQAFTNSLKQYNWGSDPQRLKLIRDSIDNVPKNLQYRQLNFVQIKNALNRCDNLIKSFVKFQNFQACAQIKKIREETDKLVTIYSKNPESNDQIYDEIEKLLQKIKETKI